ncbi:MAG: hypothetical protein U0167_11375 [bacterium]
MRARLVDVVTVGSVVLAVACAATAAPVTLSGTVSYDGSYGAGDSLYVSVIYVTSHVPVVLGYVALPRPSPRPHFSVPFTVGFDNATAPDSVAVLAILDEDHSGFDPDSLDNAITVPDILGWFDGHANPRGVDASSSQTGLDFALPKGEIHGGVAFAPGQTWAAVVPRAVPSDVNAKWADLGAPGSYAVIGLYAGDYIVHGQSDVGDMCWGSHPRCVNPDVLSLGDGEIRTGVNLDFGVLLPVSPWSWGRLKAGYR